MSEKTDKSLEFEKAKELFESLQLSDWKIDESFKTEGGQATVLAINDGKGRKGVFRYLKNQDETSKKRFYRELDILTDTKFRHKNIVNILEHTDNDEHQWYISERGENFTPFWKHQREIFSENPEGLIKSAVEIIKQICVGLKILHESGVVHRDIKPSNLIVIGEGAETFPVLIDFGVTYSDVDEERITKIDEAVGNIRYSPDVMMNRLDEVSPWLDIFQLAQVLIWMTQISPVKNWSRPLDWRWINYDDRLSEKTVLSLRAVTAQCSEQKISSQNASEFLSLLEKLFPQKNSMVENKFSLNIESIKSGTASGQAMKTLQLAGDIKILESSYVAAKRFYNNLYQDLENLVKTLQEHNLDFRKYEMDFEEFYHTLIKRNDPSENLYILRFPAEQVEPFFAVTVRCTVNLPSKIPQISGLPETSNIFIFEITRHSMKTDDLRFYRKLTIESDGKISLREENMSFIKNVEFPDVIQAIKELIEDSRAWEAIQIDR